MALLLLHPNQPPSQLSLCNTAPAEITDLAMAKVRVQGLMGLCTSLYSGQVFCVLARATVAQHDKFLPSTRNANSRQVSNRLSFTACIWCSKWLWRHLRSKSSPIATSWLCSSGMEFSHGELKHVLRGQSVQHSILRSSPLPSQAGHTTIWHDESWDTMNPR